MSPLLKGFVWGIACALVCLKLHMPDPAALFIGGFGGVVGALD
jgi:hypothetical protein